jgi:hypothetical protein
MKAHQLPQTCQLNGIQPAPVKPTTNTTTSSTNNTATFITHQGLNVQVWRGYDDFITELTARFPHEADGIRAFYGECWRVFNALNSLELKSLEEPRCVCVCLWSHSMLTPNTTLHAPVTCSNQGGKHGGMVGWRWLLVEGRGLDKSLMSHITPPVSRSFTAAAT